MAQADTLAWWNAMAPARAQLASWVGGPINGTLRTCRMAPGGETGDDRYAKHCPQPWLECLPPLQLAQALVQVFPQNYYRGCQAYVAEAWRNKPGASASAELRVLWALDLWSHVNYGLWALNLPWSSRGWAVQEAIEVFNIAEAKQRVDLKAAGASAPAEWARKLPVDLPHFMWLTVDAFGWQTITGRTADYLDPHAPDPMWGRLLQAVVPWSSSWQSAYLKQLPTDTTSEAEAKTFGADAPLAYGLWQWRLYSAVARFSKGGMGFAFPASLVTYINEVAYESTSPQIAWDSKRGRANLAWAINDHNGLEMYARAFINLDYAATVVNQMRYWSELAMFRANAFGGWATENEWRVEKGLSLGTNYDAGTLVSQPGTYTDFKDLWNGAESALRARAHAAIENPGALCEPTDQACVAASNEFAAIMTKMEKLPVYGQIITGAKMLMHALVQVFGAAMGAGKWAIFVLPTPFARTLKLPKYDTTPNGSSADVLPRVLFAVHNIDAVLGCFRPAYPTPFRFHDQPCINPSTCTWGAGPLTAVRDKRNPAVSIPARQDRPYPRFRVMLYPPGAPRTAVPATTAAPPSRPTVPVLTAEQRTKAVKDEYFALCTQGWAKVLADHPEFAGCLTVRNGEAAQAWAVLCHHVVYNAMPLPNALGAFGAWMQTYCYTGAPKGPLPPAVAAPTHAASRKTSIFAAFIEGASHPVRLPRS